MAEASEEGTFDRVLEGLQEKVRGFKLNALNMACRRKLAMFLDGEGQCCIVDSDGGNYCNDWTGLAELAGFDRQEIGTCSRARYPTMEVLHFWGQRSNPPPTIDNLLNYLCQIDRRDAIIECEKLIVRDVENYKKHQKNLQEIADKHDPAKKPKKKETPARTTDEVATGTTVYYDAFVIYNPDSPYDFNFVTELIDKYEGPEYNMKLFVPWRDDLPGAAQNSITADIIEKLCRRCLVVISRAFYDCSACDFQLKFAQALSPGARSKRVIPLMIENCKLPNILNFVGTAKFYNKNLREWQWSRTAATIKSELDPDIETWSTDSNASEIFLDTSNPSHRRLWALAVCTMDLSDEAVEQRALERQQQLEQEECK